MPPGNWPKIEGIRIMSDANHMLSMDMNVRMNTRSFGTYTVIHAMSSQTCHAILIRCKYGENNGHVACLYVPKGFSIVAHPCCL